MDGLNENRFLPFPKEDYDKNGSLKKIRSHMLKKLLKYECKATLQKIGIAAIVYTSMALFLCLFGLLVVNNTGGTELTETIGFVFWVIGIVFFVYAALFMLIFPLIITMKRYGSSLFGSLGYLTLSIPATPEEHILAKRISGFINGLVAIVVSVLGIMLAISPMEPIFGSSDVAVDALFIHDLIFWLIAFPLEILTLISICGFLRCWFHRGLKVWVFILSLVGLYFMLLYGIVAFAILSDAGKLVITPLGWRIIGWVNVALSCVVCYFTFRFETNTLRNKVNLK